MNTIPATFTLLLLLGCSGSKSADSPASSTNSQSAPERLHSPKVVTNIYVKVGPLEIPNSLRQSWLKQKTVYTLSDHPGISDTEAQERAPTITAVESKFGYSPVASAATSHTVDTMVFFVGGNESFSVLPCFHKKVPFSLIDYPEDSEYKLLPGFHSFLNELKAPLYVVFVYDDGQVWVSTYRHNPAKL